MANLDDKNISSDKPKRPGSNIIITIIIVVALMATIYFTTWNTTPYFMLKDSDTQNKFGPHGHHHPWHDANMPDPDGQKPEEIMAYMDSAAFKQLSAREQFEYAERSRQQVIEYETKTYSTLPKEQRTAYLDRIIDRIQAQRKNFEQMRQQTPQDANDPNSQWRQEQYEHHKRLMNDLRARMQARGISMPPPPGGHPPDEH
jgi:hypothetical protein